MQFSAMTEGHKETPSLDTKW